MSVFFRKIRTNENGTASIICSSEPLETKTSSISGIETTHRVSKSVQFGILSLVDPTTGKSMLAKHPTIKALQAKLNIGDELPSFQMGAPILDRDTQEPNGLFWVEAV